MFRSSEESNVENQRAVRRALPLVDEEKNSDGSNDEKLKEEREAYLELRKQRANRGAMLRNSVDASMEREE